jgi:hypothetical protein
MQCPSVAHRTKEEHAMIGTVGSILAVVAGITAFGAFCWHRAVSVFDRPTPAYTPPASNAEEAVEAARADYTMRVIRAYDTVCDDLDLLRNRELDAAWEARQEGATSHALSCNSTAHQIMQARALLTTRRDRLAS